jgi:hypothetical protein
MLADTAENMSTEIGERRKCLRRHGVGRRIHGDRRSSDQREMTLPGWRPREGPRRNQKRRSLGDRRRSPN